MATVHFTLIHFHCLMFLCLHYFICLHLSFPYFFLISFSASAMSFSSNVPPHRRAMKAGPRWYLPYPFNASPRHPCLPTSRQLRLPTPRSQRLLRRRRRRDFLPRGRSRVCPPHHHRLCLNRLRQEIKTLCHLKMLNDDEAKVTIQRK